MFLLWKGNIHMLKHKEELYDLINDCNNEKIIMFILEMIRLLKYKEREGS